MNYRFDKTIKQRSFKSGFQFKRIYKSESIFFQDVEEAQSSSEDEEFDAVENGYSFDEEQERVLESIKCVLYKIRSISKLTRSSNIIQNHVLKLIREDATLGTITMFILDFFIRWNSTQLMIQRFQKLKKIVISLTTNACEIEGIKPKNLTNLNKWQLSIQDWQLVNV